MRSEKSKTFLIIFLVGAMLLMAPLTYIRVLFAGNNLTLRDMEYISPIRSTISTRNGDVLYKGGCIDRKTFGNLIGDGGWIANTIHPLYQDKMVLKGFNPLVGLKSITEKDAMNLKTSLLSVEAHKTIQNLFDSFNGVCCVYNYVTGEVYMAMSLPSDIGKAEDVAPNSLYNNCLRGGLIPGSTMKIIAVLCALEQNPTLQNFTFVCTGKTTLADGNTVTCHGVHGRVDLTKGLGVSCNAYMAGLVQQFNVEQTQQILKKLGFLLPDSGEDVPTKGNMGELTYNYSKTSFDSTSDFSSVWGLVGQGKSAVTPLHMVTIAGAVANGGSAASPYLVENVARGNGKITYKPKRAEDIQMVSPETADLVATYWREAVQQHYGNKLNARITMAKTGTAQQGNGNNDRALMGIVEDCNTAFFILVEDAPSGSSLIFQIANALVPYLPIAQ